MKTIISTLVLLFAVGTAHADTTVEIGANWQTFSPE